MEPSKMTGLGLTRSSFFVEDEAENRRLTKEVGTFSGSYDMDSKLPFFNLSVILRATRHFSIVNKLGEGGFRPIYRGMLEDGRDIVVKCLSKTSSQGVEELKNEVILIA
ncbi:hypothetical protein ACS0TY_030029 [Phlomoides rotata]